MDTDTKIKKPGFSSKVTPNYGRKSDNIDKSKIGVGSAVSFNLKSNGIFHISVKISNDVEITKLNKQFFNRNETTDVLSFNMDDIDHDGTYNLGDIIVNKDQAARQAAKYHNDLEHEVAALVEHGVLHLLGVHHKDDDGKSVHGVKPKNIE